MYFDYYQVDYWPTTRGMYVVTKTIESKIDCYSYNYIIRRPFSNAEKQMEAVQFAEENFKGDWVIGRDCSGFESAEDAMIFKLRWL